MSPSLYRSGSLCGFVALLLSVTPATSVAQATVPNGFEDSAVAAVPYPTALAFTPDGRVLIGAMQGQIYVWQNGALVPEAALDLGAKVCAYRERGLVGLAVDPEFKFNHFVYVSYTFDKYGACDAEWDVAPVGRVSRFQLGDDNRIDPDSEQILLDNVASIIGVHNLNDVRFGPDGYLYVTVGDSGCDYAGDSGCFDTNDAARDLNALAGKVLRITRDGDVPPDNPFTGPASVRCAMTGSGPAGSTCREIFATGLRNPWRVAFDPNTAGTRFFISDVGQDTWEEINEGSAGADYGWNRREGFCSNSSMTDCASNAPQPFTNPVFAYDHSEGCSAISGGAFVPNGVWPSAFDGSYLFGDYVCGKIFRLVPLPDGGFTVDTFASDLGGSSVVDLAFGPSDAGIALYYLTHRNDGEVRRITFTSTSNRHPNAIVSASPQFGASPLEVTFDGMRSFDPDNDELTYVWDFGDGSALESGPTAAHTYGGSRAYVATLTVSDPEGATSSATVRIDVGNTPPSPGIESPSPSHTFAVGETVVLRGSATDAEDGSLSNSSLTWRVILHHNTHVHGFLPATTGNNIAFVAPPPENLEAAANSYLEVQLTAVDSRGAATTVTQQLLPRMVRLDFTTEPEGAALRIDNDTVPTPFTVMSWVNFGVAIEAPPQSGSDGSPLEFESWSDGGAAVHTIITATAPASYTARFVSAAGPSPYTGTPMSLPGVLELENFDNGGAGIAYQDSSAGNSGGQYRSTDVDIAPAVDAGGGYVVGWTEVEEWLSYSVNVAAAGTYDLEFRVASAGPGGTFHLEVDGADATGAIALPDTGDWQTWTTIRRQAVSLAAGPQVWRLVMDLVGPTGAVGNLNWLRVVSSTPGGHSEPWSGSPVVLPGVIQAEHFDIGGANLAYWDTSPGNTGGQFRLNDDVDLAIAADAGSGHTVGWTEAGEWLNYSVSVEADGVYDLAFRVASAGPGGTFHLEANGVDKTGPITIPDTGGWQSWTNISRSGIPLSAGTQRWRLVMDSPGGSGAIGNINWIAVTASGTPPGSKPYTGAPVALPGVIEAENFDEGPQGVAYHDSTSGNTGGAYRASGNVDIGATTDAGGGYRLGWTDAGEWLAYTVDVVSAGTYDIEVRVASNGGGGVFHIEANGVDITGPLSVPNTTGWQSWVVVRRAGVSLRAGTQIWRLVLDANGATGAVGNINWIKVSAGSPPESTPSGSPFGGTAAIVPGRVEAENFNEGESGVAYWDSESANIGGLYRPVSGVDIARITEGGGYTIGWTAAGEWLNYTVNVTAAGTYDLEVRVASHGPGGVFHLEVGGVDKTGPLAIPDTGGWQSWVTVASRGVPLSAGQQVWRLVLDSVGTTGAVGNIDWIQVTASAAPSAGLSRGPYLQQMTSTGVVVVWATRVAGPGEVHFTADGGGSLQAAPAVSRTLTSSATGLPFDVYQHEARLTGLSPSSRYTYDVLMASVDATAGQHTFTTSPPVGTSTVRFVAFGDSGVGSAAQRQVAARLATESFDLAIHTGDVAYGSTVGIGAGDYSTFDAWVFDIYRAWLPSKPFFPSIGNHDDEFDSARAYRDVFVLPRHGASSAYPDHAERYYSYDYGPVHFVVLDTELAFQDPARRAEQIAWLERDLASTSQPWRVAYFHRPPFSAGYQHGSELDVRDAFVPIFERHGVQLVISGHEHGYQRSVPIRQYVANARPILYVVTGGGGAPLHPLGSESWTAVAAEVHHYVRLSVSGCSLTGEAVRAEGAVFDRFTVDRCAAASLPGATEMTSVVSDDAMVPSLAK